MFQIKVVEETEMHILHSVTFFSENCAICDIMWINMVVPDKAQMTIWRMHFACWITQATNTELECAIRIACPQQQWLNECTSVLGSSVVVLKKLGTLM